MTQEFKTPVLDDVEKAEGRGLSRRTVMVGAAWSVPVIVAAVSAPAAAASGETKPGALIYDTWRNNWLDDDAHTGKFVSVRSGAQIRSDDPASLSGIIHSVTFPSGLLAAQDPISVTGAGWMFLERTGSTYLFTYGPTLERYQSSSELNFVVLLAKEGKVEGSTGKGTATVNGTTSNAPAYGDPIY